MSRTAQGSLLLLAFAAGSCAAELPELERDLRPGHLSGSLVEYGCFEPAPELSVRIVSTAIEIAADAEGRFDVELEPGDWQITVVGPGIDANQIFGPFPVAPAERYEIGTVAVMPTEIRELCSDGETPDLWPGTPDAPAEGEGWEEDPTDYGDMGSAEQGLEALGIARQGLGEDTIATVVQGQAGGCEPLVTTRVSTRNITGGHCSRAPDGTLLEDYVKGVVYGEVAIVQWFRDDTNRRLRDDPNRLVNLYKTFAVAARTYVVNRTNNRPQVRVDSGPTFQCYVTPPRGDAVLNRAIEETAGQYLVFRENGEMLTSEYAAACHADHTRPEAHTGYVGEADYIADNPRVTLRMRGLRQHNTCGGHEGGGDCGGPDSALNTTRNRRVRGVCQTGSGERAMGGDDYLTILGHYQPYARVCGAAQAPGDQGDAGDAGEGEGDGAETDPSLAPVSPKDETITDPRTIRFTWRDDTLAELAAAAKWELFLRKEGGETRSWILQRAGDQPRGAADGSQGTLLSWTPSDAQLPLLAAVGEYTWWMTRLGESGETLVRSAEARFQTVSSVGTVWVLPTGEGQNRVPEGESGPRIDSVLVVPESEAEPAEGQEPTPNRVNRAVSGDAGAYPYAILQQAGNPEENSAQIYQIIQTVPGTYSFYLFDGTSPQQGASTLFQNRSTVVVGTGAGYQRFVAPRGIYNVWKVFTMGEDLRPAAANQTGTCNYLTEPETCIESMP